MCVGQWCLRWCRMKIMSSSMWWFVANKWWWINVWSSQTSRCIIYYINLRLWGTPSRLRNVHVRTCFKCGRKRILVHPLPLCTLFCEPHVVCAIPFLSNTFLRQWDVSEFPDDQTRQRKMQSASLANCMDLNSNLLIWGMSEVSK